MLVFRRGGSLKTGAGMRGERGWEEIGILLVFFLFLFLDLAVTLPGLGWKSGSSESEPPKNLNFDAKREKYNNTPNKSFDGGY